jgi:hypothetical protein
MTGSISGTWRQYNLQSQTHARGHERGSSQVRELAGGKEEQPQRNVGGDGGRVAAVDAGVEAGVVLQLIRRGA